MEEHNCVFVFFGQEVTWQTSLVVQLHWVHGARLLQDIMVGFREDVENSP